MSKLKDIQRRDFLKFLGLGYLGTMSPLAVLADSIVNGFVNKAYAQSAGINPRRFLYIQMPGAPQRWAYDQFLNPFNSSGFIDNPQAVTQYTASGGRYTGATYGTTTVKGVRAPIIWGQNLPAPGNSTRPMSDLMDNLLAIQGLDSGSNAHRAARNNVFLPLGSLQSLTALSSDYSEFPIKAAQNRNSDYRFLSLKGTTHVNVDGSNLISSLMDPFTNRAGSTFTNKKNQLNTALQAATADLAAKAELEHRGSAAVESDRASAQELLGQAVGDMNTFWSNGLNKYRSLITRTMAMTVPGINDLPIGATSGRGRMYRYGTSNNADVIVNNADLRSVILSNGTISRLAEQFTLAEYIFSNNLSHSLSINPSRLRVDINGSNRTLQTDEHTVGRMISLVGNAFHYMAFSACLLELINSLKAANVFNDTVIALCGDFARSPRTDGGGSDHGRYASHFTFYSGAIQGPMILGRMRKGSTSGNYIGTWGEGDRSRDYGTALVTAAKLLRVPTPLTARNSMVTENNGVITAAAENSTLF